MDEVNLLDDGLVDVVLDSAASGVNTVEREGVSIAHPARFIMIGSGNPQARPQSPYTIPPEQHCIWRHRRQLPSPLCRAEGSPHLPRKQTLQCTHGVVHTCALMLNTWVSVTRKD